MRKTPRRPRQAHLRSQQPNLNKAVSHGQRQHLVNKGLHRLRRMARQLNHPTRSNRVVRMPVLLQDRIHSLKPPAVSVHQVLQIRTKPHLLSSSSKLVAATVLDLRL